MKISRFELRNISDCEIESLVNREFDSLKEKRKINYPRFVFKKLVAEALKREKRICVSRELQWPTLLSQTGKNNYEVSDNINQEISNICDILGKVCDESFSLEMFYKLKGRVSSKEAIAIMMSRGMTNGKPYSSKDISSILGMPIEDIKSLLNRAARFMKNDYPPNPNLNDYFLRK